MSNWSGRHKWIMVTAIVVTIGVPVAAQAAAPSAHGRNAWNAGRDPTPAGECPKEKRPPRQPVAVPVQFGPLGCPYRPT